jgi:DNA invertase Pin-like site-specific DNA recombinase/stress-induced morphogen
MIDGSTKVTPSHLQRAAYLYVRQSTLRQVVENTESTKRQYALRQRAVALGWPPERVIVIDCDQGQSGASATDRAGFQRLVSEVGLGHAGLVLGLEVSRLARSSTDWHRLLEICALTGTLILDEDGLDDPAHFNDRLLLGLKGTMSEAELHVLRARLQGGIRNKARRGELKAPLPIGLVYDADDRVILDPDRQIQEALRLFFATFRRTGSASATVRTFREQGLDFPRRVRTGLRKGELVWGPLLHCRALQILHNPRYAGAFFFGRTRTRTMPDGRVSYELRPREQWDVLLPETHPGYLTWAEYEDNLRQLRANAQAIGAERRRSPPREGPALLQGLAICGVCGECMTVRYHQRGSQLVPDYACQRRGIERGEPPCQVVPGADVDAAIGALLIEAVTPLALEVTLAVQDELVARAAEADQLRQQQVARARYEADLARRRFMQVDPDHRLVADTLEGEWNEKLHALAAAQEEYERHHQHDALVLDEQRRAEILALASDFPRLWQSPQTSDRDRKRIVHLLLEDVTLLKRDAVCLQVRFKGGATRTLTVPLPRCSWQIRQTNPQVVAEIDRLLDQHTDAEIAGLLNAQGLHPGDAPAFHARIVARLRRDHGLADRFHRLRARGLLTLAEMAALLEVSPSTVKIWHAHGLIRGTPFNDKGECLYDHPGTDPPRKQQGRKFSHRRPTSVHVESSARGAV